MIFYKFINFYMPADWGKYQNLMPKTILQSKTVLHLIGGGEIGGAEKHILTLLPLLAKQDLRPLLGCLYAESPLAERVRTQADIPVTLFPMRSPFDLRPLPQVLRFCRQFEVDLIHSHGLRANLLGRLAARDLCIPALSTLHSWPETDYPNPRRGKMALRAEQLTLSLTSGFITVSEYLRQRLLAWPAVQHRLARAAEPGGKPFRINRIYNGYAPQDSCLHPINEDGLSWAPLSSPAASPRLDAAAAARAHFRARWHIAPDAPVLGTIGRLHPIKGQSVLVEAASLLASHYPNLHLVIIGEGPDRPALEKALANAPFAYTLPGYLEEAARALPAFDLFALPSLEEGMGLVLLEAMAARTPIVASAVGGIPEVLRADIDALLVPSGNSPALAAACHRLLADRFLVNRLTTAAWERLTLFSPQKMAAETAAIYQSILSVNN